MKKFIIFISISTIILFLGQDLNPFSPYFFTFHDETQPARIQQFTKELKNLHIPPRVAPDMNFGIGYPVFNFYAPTAYWITSFFHLLNFSIINALKISFLAALILAFYGAFKFFTLFFDFWPALAGGFFYVLSLYFPLDIFVRGNLAEIWFLALLPLSIFFIIKISQKKIIDKKIFLTNTIILTIILTSHNIFSLIFFIWIIPFIILFSKNRLINLISLLTALGLGAYFWLPVILETKYTFAKEVATLTFYQNHFLCPTQLWQSPWGFGGSAPGCLNDGMSFKIGKVQVILFIFGVFFFAYHLLISKKNKSSKSSFLPLYFLISTCFFLFLTVYQSAFFWKLFENYLNIIQFPWRFIGLSILGIAFFSSYFLQAIKIPYKSFLIFLVILTTFLLNQKYFFGQKIKNEVFEKKYLSQNYIKNQVAFKMAEYLPKTNNYQLWRSLEKKKTTKNDIKKLTLAPFDKKKQTPIEVVANLITLLSFIFLIFFSRYYGKKL